jgi:enamine deaminase RidA (YjgF/YER057c/UK114 family)
VRLTDQGLVLPKRYVPGSAYLPTRRHGDLVFCAGVTSRQQGQVGADVGLDEGSLAAQQCALLQLAAIEHELGSLDAVQTVLRLTGYVYAVMGFADSPSVLDAASEVFTTAFGAAGEHARSAVAVAGLPGGASVELEVVLAIHPGAVTR